jgi:nitroimidazol reductase NimA-like FMN-containing flavoprotein (pyridoxamine 5'-phosphate oxidase superfamily)
VSRRDQIKMAPDEVDAFVREQRVVICASNGHRGWPHLMPLWYVIRGDDIWCWTYAKSQKVRNLERDPRATLQIEHGEQYHELRGVMIEAHTEIHRDTGRVAEFGVELFERYGSATTGPEFLEVVRAQAAKRVALQFVGERLSTWDHAKLGGVY